MKRSKIYQIVIHRPGGNIEATDNLYVTAAEALAFTKSYNSVCKKTKAAAVPLRVKPFTAETLPDKYRRPLAV